MILFQINNNRVDSEKWNNKRKFDHKKLSS